jgi:PmbA protein
MSGLVAQLRGQDQLLTQLKSALGATGTESSEGFITVRHGEYTRFAGTRVHQPQAIEESQLLVRAAAGSGSARVGTTRLEAAEWAGRQAGLRARSMSKLGGPTHPVAEVAPVPHGLPLWQDDTPEWDADRRRSLAIRAIRTAESAGAIANGMFSTVLVELAVANSAGISLYACATEATCSILVRHGLGSGFRSDIARSADGLKAERLVEDAVADALRTTHPQELPPGSYDVVLGPLAVCDMLTFFAGIGFTGSAVAAGSGPVARRPGAQVAAAGIHVVDDATRPIGLPIPFDLEGVGKRPVRMLEGGRVGAAVFDLATAAAVGGRSSGHAHIAREQAPEPTPANLILEPGPLSQTELIAGVERGVYVSRFHYTRMVDPELTSFTGVTRDASFLIESGQLGPAVTASRFTEEIFPVLSRVDGIGSDVVSLPIMNVWNGASSAPALRVRGFRLGFH